MWFDLLYRQQAPRMIQVARRVLGNRETAEDIVQNVFLIALAHEKELQQMEKPNAWLYRVLRNQIGNELQRARYRTTTTLEDTFDLESTDLTPLLLEHCLPKELPDSDQRILISFFEKQLSHEEIAKELGISIFASKTRLFRAKTKYKKLLLNEK